MGYSIGVTHLLAHTSCMKTKMNNHSIIKFKYSFLSIACLVVLGLTGCSDDPEPAVDVIADFTTNSTSILEGGNIAFSDQSIGDPTSWNWNFEGGTPATSLEENPVVVYSKPGVYSVSLVVTNESSENSITKNRLIHVTCEGIYCEPLFTSYDKTEDIIYGNDSDQHKMIIYQPQNDTRMDRPVVLLTGGGGFEFASDLSLLEPLAINLVKHGVVVALARYRIVPNEDGSTRLIVAQQDSRTAVRYLRKEASSWGLDPGLIFNGGYGAGAFSALFHAYVDESDLSTNEVNFINSLGGMEGLDQGNSGHSSEVLAVISLAGAIPDYNNLNLITSNDVSIFAIHGTADAEVPYESSGNNPVTFGSKPIVEKVRSVGLAGYLFTIENGDHTAPRQYSDEYILELMYFLREILE